MRHRAPFLDVDDWPDGVSNPRQSNHCSHVDDIVAIHTWDGIGLTMVHRLITSWLEK